MVLDPTCTGLNEILVKGENKLGCIEDILVRNRGHQFVFSTDISKMYNVLHLDPSAYPYSLILFRDGLQPDAEPEVFLMLRAWYGVRPTGNQAMYAISQLAEAADDDHKEAAAALKTDLYAGSTKELDKIIEDMRYILQEGDFGNKFICKSGEQPCEKASPDGETVKVLGYVWRPKEDTYALSYSNLNFHKKRDKKVVNITTQQQLDEHILDVRLTRRTVLSKIAAFYDPVGPR